MGIRQTTAAVGIALAVAGVGGAAVYAATDHPQQMHGGPPPHWDGDGPGGPPGMGRRDSDRSDPATLHGEAVAADDTGAYRTTVTQTGTVTGLDGNSLTVRSDDGFTQRYTLPASVAAALTSGQQVTLQATRPAADPHATPVLTSIANPKSR